jgi:two-component system LytT family response regulator
MTMIRTIIVDDETKSRRLLKNLLSTYCENVEVVGEADSVQKGLTIIKEQNPDLVFLDIVLRNDNGFDILKKIDSINFEIIFTTAHNEYAIKAIRVSALDYLLKPLNVDELTRAVEKVSEKMINQSADKTNEPLLNFIENQKSLNKNVHKIGVPTLTGIDFIQMENIVFCKAEGNYTHITLKNKDIVVTRTLKEFEELLSDYNFLRVHRSYLINLDHILKYNRTYQLPNVRGDGGSVTLSNNLEVPVSRVKRKTLLDLFSKPF